MRRRPTIWHAEPAKSRGQRTQHERKNEHDAALLHVAVDELADAGNEERHNRCQDRILSRGDLRLGGGDRRGSAANARIGGGSSRPLRQGCPAFETESSGRIVGSAALCAEHDVLRLVWAEIIRIHR